ncbi:hypothetical protein DPEC_G00117290 [Dallia pectoralis]|uniref:Uncharacterized protein n=1 Tax=Dallia pectoralis TaxID=75939 RepID=A0ACC2GVJ1_DALPE|nr:hypothetical protein DPEC_G00117290 [Dallia pectoralis]
MPYGVCQCQLDVFVLEGVETRREVVEWYPNPMNTLILQGIVKLPHKCLLAGDTFRAVPLSVRHLYRKSNRVVLTRESDQKTWNYRGAWEFHGLDTV